MKKAWLINPVFRNVLAVAFGVSLFSSACAGQQETYVDGLWVHGNTVVLMARFDSCGGPYRPVQPIVSVDGGLTWAADGPQFDGAELLYIMSEGDHLLVAGQMYAEGPTNSPFLLTYNFDLHQWSQSDIYDGAAELLGLARERDTGHLLAWVGHIDMSSDDDSAPVFLHESVDGGKTWSLAGDVQHIPVTAPRLQFFSKLPEQSGRWRISHAGDFLEKKRADGNWHQEVHLPLPIQQQCPEVQDDTQP